MTWVECALAVYAYFAVGMFAYGMIQEFEPNTDERKAKFGPWVVVVGRTIIVLGWPVYLPFILGARLGVRRG